MSMQARDLEIEQDLEFQRREWMMQRAGWWGSQPLRARGITAYPGPVRPAARRLGTAWPTAVCSMIGFSMNGSISVTSWQRRGNTTAWNASSKSSTQCLERSGGISIVPKA